MRKILIRSKEHLFETSTNLARYIFHFVGNKIPIRQILLNDEYKIDTIPSRPKDLGKIVTEVARRVFHLVDLSDTRDMILYLVSRNSQGKHQP